MRHILLIVSCLFLLGGLTGGAAAQEAPRAGLIAINYERPSDPALQPFYERARQAGMLEKMQSVFSPIRLPRTLTLRTIGCEGDINAYYENDAISICYEYIRYIAELAESRTRPSGLSARDAFLGPLLEVFLHEGAHAIFDYLKVPLFGKEEDAADQFAALGLLSFEPDQSLAYMNGIVHMYLREGGFRNIRQLKRRRFAVIDPSSLADEHSTPLQRMFSALCMAAGSGFPGFAEAAREGGLPDTRAALCKGEFAQVVHAFRTLILPHVDLTLAGDKARLEWFKPLP